ncbi:MAG: NAD(P)H-hydrate dehydratase [Bacteroidota bacterium]
MRLSNAAQIREADRIQIEDRHLPGILLMEQAGRLAADRILEYAPDQHSYFILAGPGNNGGDGLVIARYLYLAGKEAQVLLSHPGERYQGDALINYRILAELPVPMLQYEEESLDDMIRSFDHQPILIDALLGTGIQSVLRPPVSQLIEDIRTFSLHTIAIDLPSGLSASTGESINSPLRADLTLTFQLPKVCHHITPASLLCGKVEVIDIGIWPEVIQQLGIQRYLLTEDWLQAQHKPASLDAHKGTMGHLLSIGGSRNMAGAIALCGYASLKSGVGLSTVLTPGSCRSIVLGLAPELMCISSGDMYAAKLDAKSLDLFDQYLVNKQAVVIGPGLGTHPDTAALLEAILPRIQVPLVLDADALNLLSQHPAWWNMLPDSTILTPHPGEMRRLVELESIHRRRLEIAERLAQDRQVIVVLKGAGTIVALPDGTSYVNTSGNPGMATAGSGDVLTGIIGSCLAQGYSAGIAAAMAVYLHGKSGDLAAANSGMASLTARDLCHHIRM